MSGLLRRSADWLCQMAADERAALKVSASPLADMADEALYLGCERVWLKAGFWDEISPSVGQLTPPGNVTAGSFQYSSIFFDRGAQ